MTTRITLNPLVASIVTTPQQAQVSVVPLSQADIVPQTATAVAPYPVTPQPVRRPVSARPMPIAAASGTAPLSHFLRIGRQYHALCKNTFMEKRVIGYYHYERRVQYSTCAVAAAYAGAFGPKAIERPGFSYSMALWRLSQKVGYDLNHLHVYGPTGRCQPVAREMMQLIDTDHWTREGIAEWLESLKL